MRPVKKADGIIFADSKTEKAFNSLSENSPLKKYKIDNLFWYKLSKEWRLVYSVAGNNVEVLAIIIEYFSSHKEYERRFKY